MNLIWIAKEVGEKAINMFHFMMVQGRNTTHEELQAGQSLKHYEENDDASDRIATITESLFCTIPMLNALQTLSDFIFPITV